jgi:hypothetical protein
MYGLDEKNVLKSRKNIFLKKLHSRAQAVWSSGMVSAYDSMGREIESGQGMGGIF